ncbi:MAG: NERD domain-containing protein [Chroococcus sp. CMT-3BRIN-NPC107]|jgi:predicted outer membrane lipoprotein|nr:NERD domain-containing protein [Chroococcus sp. CMT-3BRIN-NPC107]
MSPLGLLVWGRGRYSIPLGVYLACSFLATINAIAAQHLWKRADDADRGAAAEEQTAAILQPLQDRGWQIEYKVPLPKGGDVDIFLLSPQGNAYVIDVKSHQGEVRVNSDRLYRQYGKFKYEFEKDFLRQVKYQAVFIRELKKLKFVTLMVVFSRANVQSDRHPIAGVYVLGVQQLLHYLQL